MISAIILSAGSSKRMGSPKALLKLNEKNFLQHIIGILLKQNIPDITVVLGAHAREIESGIKAEPVKIVINEQWENGQLSSLIAGLDSINTEQTTGVLVWPVDHPLVSGTVIDELINAFENTPQKIIIPKFGGKRGHPVIFPQRIFSDLRTTPLDEGARSIVKRNEESVYEVETSEESVVINIDTPEDYHKFVVAHDYMRKF